MLTTSIRLPHGHLSEEVHLACERTTWDAGELKLHRAHAVRVVGPELEILETPNSLWKDHPDPAVMDRSTRLWGVQGRRILQNLRVGVAGAGGTGSIVIPSLATTGVGK